MPRISVEATPDTLNSFHKASLEAYLQDVCPEMFSTDSRPLRAEHFRVVFPVFDRISDTPQEVVVCMRLDADPERLDRADAHAQELQAGITMMLSRVDEYNHTFTIGVSLDYGVKLVWCDQNGLAD